MAKAHKYARASASMTTQLNADQVAALCEEAAKQSESMQVLIRLEDSKQGRLVYSARNRMVGGRIEFMTFEVVLSDSGEQRHVRTRLLSYKQKRQWILIVPMPWQMIAWGSYKKFMYSLAAGISRADPGARTQVVERPAA